MILLNTLLIAQVENNISNAVLISLLATLGFTAFSVVLSSIYKKNFVEPSLLGKVIGHHLKDSPSWLNIILGSIIHFFVGYLFTETHLFLYQIYTPIWYNALFFGIINGLIGAFVWYITIKLYPTVLKVNVTQYLTQLVIGHVIFGLIIIYMYAPPH